MSSQSRTNRGDLDQLDAIKSAFGRTIEERRRRLRVTQGNLAERVGIGERWLREIEAGNPSSTIENHLRCAYALGMKASNLFVPILFLEQDIVVPFDVLVDDPAALRNRCLDCIAEYCLEAVSMRLRRSVPR